MSFPLHLLRSGGRPPGFPATVSRVRSRGWWPAAMDVGTVDAAGPLLAVDDEHAGGADHRWMLLICERDCSSTETKRSWLVLRWWLGVAVRAGVKVERPERGGDDDLDAGEGGHRMQQRRTSLGGTVASGDHFQPASSTRVPKPSAMPRGIAGPSTLAAIWTGSWPTLVPLQSAPSGEMQQDHRHQPGRVSHGGSAIAGVPKPERA